MTAPVAYQIINAVRGRLALILTTGGYNTNLGTYIYLGKRQVNEHQLDDGPQLQIYATDDTPQESDRHVDPMQIELNMVVIGSALVGAVNPLLMAFNMIQDIKSAALVIDGYKLGGLSLDLGYAGSSIAYTETGGDAVEVSVNFTALYEETYGAP